MTKPKEEWKYGVAWTGQEPKTLEEEIFDLNNRLNRIAFRQVLFTLALLLFAITLTIISRTQFVIIN
jgi:hypothetical protein